MYQLLQRHSIVQTVSKPCRVEEFLGGGGQGEVYRAALEGRHLALKWYFPEQATDAQRRNLEILIRKGPPSNDFLWPLQLAQSPAVPGFGYIMPLREERYKGLVDLMKCRVDPSFRVLATVGLRLAQGFLKLHSKGFCYRDISFGNVFFDPDSGDIQICDNDNVTIDGTGDGGVMGTPRFMAPEVVRGEVSPSTQTDLFSLAVLLFYIFMTHHPLEGKREVAIKCFDLPAMNKLYGTEPLFIYDPNDAGNRPLPGYHNNAIDCWNIYPTFLRELFVRAFTTGLHDPHERVRESEWAAFMVQLRDSIMFCGHCGNENFNGAGPSPGADLANRLCWDCRRSLVPPLRIHIGRAVVMLNHDTELYPHHLDSQRIYDFGEPLAKVQQHPKDPGTWGLKNLSTVKWSAVGPDGVLRDVEPGRSVTLSAGLRVYFADVEGEIRS